MIMNPNLDWPFFCHFFIVNCPEMKRNYTTMGVISKEKHAYNYLIIPYYTLLSK